jgi:ribA/ribD-fused uncharacterized protein
MGRKVGLKMKTGKLAPLIKEYYPDYYLWCEYPSNQCVTIRKVDEEWGILGNFHPTPLNIDGLTFVNSEQLFQCFKFRDKETLLSIYNKRGLPIKWSAKSGEAKGYRREDWGKIIIDVMKYCLQMKYDQSLDFRNSLKDTSGCYIVEDQTNSKTNKKTGEVKDADTWGVVLRDDKYVGSNLLGRLLMELRETGKLNYKLPEDAFYFISILKQ